MDTVDVASTSYVTALRISNVADTLDPDTEFQDGPVFGLIQTPVVPEDRDPLIRVKRT